MSRKAVEHDFEEQEFANFTKCFVCDELIANEIVDGVIHNLPGRVKRNVPDLIADQVPKDKGCTCKRCGLNVHLKCRDRVGTKCTYVAHNFELRSYPPFSKMCAACGTTLQGLYHQGYRCTECGIDVHPGCRTNAIVQHCAARPEESDSEDEIAEKKNEKSKAKKADQDVDEKAEEEYEDADVDSNWLSHENQRKREKKKKQKKKEEGKKGGDQKRKAKQIKVPSSIDDIGVELRKAHTQARAVAVAKAEKWDEGEMPKLREARKDLTRYSKKLRVARDKMAVRARKLAKARASHYRSFLRKLFSKHATSRIAEIDNWLEEYSKLSCREDEMLDELEAQFQGNSTALGLIAKERKSGPLKDKKLERTIEDLEQLRKETSTALKSLEAVRRELHFPRFKHWFARLSLEGMYVALGNLWIERVSGACAVRCALIPKPKKENRLLPTVVVALCGVDSPVTLDQLGAPGMREGKTRHKSGSAGMKVVARIQDLSVSGSGLPLSFTVDEVSLDLEYFLNIEMEYLPKSKRHPRGKWRLKKKGFKIVFKRFGLNFKAGSINVPDPLLRAVVKRLITSAAKQVIKAILPPELGMYLYEMQENVPDDLRTGSTSMPEPSRSGMDNASRTTNKEKTKQKKRKKNKKGPPENVIPYDVEVKSRNGGGVYDEDDDEDDEDEDEVLDEKNIGIDQFKFYSRIEIEGLVDLDTLNFDFGSESFANSNRAGAMLQRRLKKWAGGNSADKTERTEEITEMLLRALGLDHDQLELLVRTQRDMGLTRDSMFPDDSIRELGLKALYGGDLQGTIEAANRIGMKAIAGDLISDDTAPLRTLHLLIEYVRLYFGDTPEDTAKNVYAPKLQALWQGALDVTAKAMGGGSFRSRFLPGQTSARKVLSNDSGSNRSMGDDAANNQQQQENTGPARIDFPKLVEQVQKVNRQRLLTEIQVLEADWVMGIVSLLNVVREMQLNSSAQKKGGGAMLFQLRHSKLAESILNSNDGDELDEALLNTIDLEGDEEDDELLASDLSYNGESQLDELLEGDSSTPGNSNSNASSLENGGNKLKTLEDDDVDDAMAQFLKSTRDLNQSSGGAYAKKQGEKEVQINQNFDKLVERVDYVREHLITTLSTQVQASIGDGRFDFQTMNSDLVTPVNFQLFLSTSVFGNQSRRKDWPWRRVVRTNDDGLIEASMVRVVQRGRRFGEDKHSDPDSPDGLHALLSKCDAIIQSSTPRQDIMHVRVVPKKATKPKDPDDPWAMSGAVALEWEDATPNENDLTFHVVTELFRVYGGLEMLHDYAADLLQWSTRSMQERFQVLLQVVLRKLMKYAQMNTYHGSNACQVRVGTDDREIYVRVSRSEADPDAKPLTMELEHDFIGFTDDVVHIVETYQMDPLALDLDD